MTHSPCRLALAICLLSLFPASAGAQQATNEHRLWLVAGGTSTTMLGDCTNCEIDTYLHSGGVMADIGVSLNPRASLGAEVFWVPVTLTTGDRIKVTFLMAAADFRPWKTHGFFLKTGAGMAFLRNWLSALDDQEPPVRSKAFALAIGAGWEWKVRGRAGVQVFGAQHATALGDMPTSERTIQNVMGNFWSVGAAIVLR
jgi:hypothetical protein